MLYEYKLFISGLDIRRVLRLWRNMFLFSHNHKIIVYSYFYIWSSEKNMCIYFPSCAMWPFVGFLWLFKLVESIFLQCISDLFCYFHWAAVRLSSNLSCTASPACPCTLSSALLYASKSHSHIYSSKQAREEDDFLTRVCWEAFSQCAM